MLNYRALTHVPLPDVELEGTLDSGEWTNEEIHRMWLEDVRARMAEGCRRVSTSALDQ